MLEVILKRFEQPDEIRTFEKSRFELVRLGGMTIGRATYEPGWKWSEHVGRAAGAKSCAVEHLGMVLSGRATSGDGRRPGDRDEGRRRVLHLRRGTTAGWWETSRTCRFT